MSPQPVSGFPNPLVSMIARSPSLRAPASAASIRSLCPAQGQQMVQRPAEGKRPASGADTLIDCIVQAAMR